MDDIVKQVLFENPCAALGELVIVGYKKGYFDALESYAWWKDGVQYVGCGVRTLKESVTELEKKEL